mgnify:CR=1 FL=1
MRVLSQARPQGNAMNIKIDALNYYGATKKYHLHFPALREDIEADVVIIGGGFSGINTALELAEQGITNVVVLEARHLGYGGTGRNGGQVMAGIGHDIEAVKKHVGKEGLETLFKIANLGAGIIRERIRKYNIDADFVPGYGYLAYNQRQLKTLRQWEKEFKAATPDEEIELYTGKEVQQVVGSEVYCGALKHMGGGQIHSLNMLLGSAQAAHSLGVNLPRLRLLINAGPNQPRVQLTEVLRENPAEPPMLCMLLRKHLVGGRITEIEQSGLERIVTFTVRSVNELGESGTKKLVLEAMGRRSKETRRAFERDDVSPALPLGRGRPHFGLYAPC